jgi:uncharacterized repeat protein (TIGR03803 family)
MVTEVHQMPKAKPSATLRSFTLTTAITFCCIVTCWAGGKERVLYNFQGQSDGAYPVGGVIFDGNGNLYGTTDIGGGGPCIGGCGTVFKLTPTKEGEWRETIIHAFQSPDGQNPQARLVFDKEGNLYGTTTESFSGGGTVFKLSPTKSGPWIESTIHSFNCFTNDGCYPYSYLILDKAGNLYGTTLEGGGGDNSETCTNGCGTVFELSPQKNGAWKETILYSFSQNLGPDGANPYAGLITDGAGNLYGTTSSGGQYKDGAVFRLSRGSNGQWQETVLHSFNDNGVDGWEPIAPLAIDKSANLYGTTSRGGGALFPVGVVFRLSHGEWKETILHNFASPRYVDGEYPSTGLVGDAAGNIYGLASDGGGENEDDCQDNDGCGVLFQLSSNGNTWTESIGYAFQGGLDGGFPSDDVLTIDAHGDLFGTAVSGGTGGTGAGVVFGVQP